MFRVVALFALMLLPISLASQNRSESPTIHVSTHLVQFGIIVRDKNGPVADLTRDEFVILDRGKPQKIAVFNLEAGNSAKTPVQALPPNTFSDLPQYRVDAPRSVTIVLLDNLNTLYGSAPAPYESSPSWFEDFALENAKHHLAEFIRQLDPRDRVAIYGLGDSLHVLCDFTSDRSELLGILRKYDTSSKSNRGLVEPGSSHAPVPGTYNSSVNQSNLQAAGDANQRRAETTMFALRAIAAHVANMPGRKNLVWLTANLPFSGTGMASILSPAQIAIYPVDGRGLLTRSSPGVLEGTMDADAVARGNFMPAQSPQPIGIDTMQEMAQETGGQAFVNTNDLTGAIRTAVEASGVTYTLGFYLDPKSADGKFHALKVQVDRRGLKLRYPTGYFAAQDAPTTKETNSRAILAALHSPLESSLIPVQVKVVRVEQPLPHCLSVFGSIDIQHVRLAQTNDMRKGVVEIVTVEQDETGKIIRQSASRLTLNVKPKEYETYLKSGLPFHQFIQPEQGVTTLRLVVQDPGTAKIGSLIIPLSDLK